MATKVSFIVSDEQLEQLRALATVRGITMTEVLREAIADAWYDERLRREGTRQILHKRNGELLEIIPRH